MKQFTVQIVNWQDSEALLRTVREQVFMHEQGVSAALEWDGLDDNCLHALALNPQGEAIGCARMTTDAHIGRMAVLKKWRGKKVGTALLQTLLDEASKQGYTEIDLDAQLQAVAFYRRFGLMEEGDMFMDADIPHKKMSLRLK
ncbi:MAG: GNAT family N-acetyltransferase [Gallionellaceae bacterium]